LIWKEAQMSLTAETATDRDLLGEQTREQLRIALSSDPGERDRIHEQVVHNHLWLADSLARRFRRPSEDIEDLQQVARTGLVQAVRRYDPEHGPFTAFAVPTITGVLRRHFRDHGWLVRPPRRTQELSAQMRQQWPDLTQRLRTAPSDREVAESLGASLDAVREAMCANQGYRSDSLDAVSGRGSDDGYPDDISQCENRLMLARVWRQLTPEERRLLVLRFYEERSQSDIADRIGTSQMQVSRLLARTLRRLRTMIGGLEELQEAS
jgi:RNA polymerase sigma-B factor